MTYQPVGITNGATTQSPPPISTAPAGCGGLGVGRREILSASGTPPR